MMDFRLRVVLVAALCLCVLHVLISGPEPPWLLSRGEPRRYSPLFTNSTYTYPVDTLNESDYTRLIDLYNFTFKILNTSCNESSPFVLVLVHSAPNNSLKRTVIRDTWGRSTEQARVLFMLGATEDSDLQHRLELENKVHGDLVQGNFHDAYRNMTYKHGMLLKFAIYHCPNAKYVLKLDDDVFVNMFSFLEFLQDISPYGATKMLVCNVIKNAMVLRSYRSKWHVSFKEYPDRYYPTYCPGWAILYSTDVLFKLYRELQRSQYFWIDDVLITGILAKQLQLKHTNSRPFILDYRSEQDIVKHHYTNPHFFLLSLPDRREETIRRLWNYTVLVNKNKSNNQKR